VLFYDIVEGEMIRDTKKDGVAQNNGRERLWTVERFNLRQIKMDTG